MSTFVTRSKTYLIWRQESISRRLCRTTARLCRLASPRTRTVTVGACVSIAKMKQWITTGSWSSRRPTQHQGLRCSSQSSPLFPYLWRKKFRRNWHGRWSRCSCRDQMGIVLRSRVITCLQCQSCFANSHSYAGFYVKDKILSEEQAYRYAKRLWRLVRNCAWWDEA